ncbi:hypothetical protein OUZ56_003202 [Daphnia magna]|uniref:Uncharacterized protein n=1 Tax=Daphnia magna TaxID=35525 RepID=A0ABR0A879_9CRUS|nr:hypothetical protein OUZ56_003202 [Daphnia magna]
MMAQIEDKYSVTDIKEKPLKKKIKALWLEKFKKLKNFCIFSIPFPEPTCENAAVTTSASEETKEQKIAVTSDHLGDHEDQPGLKNLDQLELLHSILHDAHLTPGDDQRASNAVHQAETFRVFDRPWPTAKIKKRSRGCTKEPLLLAQRRCMLVCPAA